MISGSIQKSNALGANTPLGGVRVDLTGSSTRVTMTDANGNYSLTVATGGDYTVTPSDQENTFEPLSRTYTNVTADITSANFVAFGSGRLQRHLRVDTTYVESPGQAAVPIVLTGLGNERKVSFSLMFDTARLGSPVVTCGPDAPLCVIMQANSAAGTVGIMVTFATLPAPGERRILTVTFAANSGANSNTPVLFSGSPTALVTTDTAGNPLAIGYTSGFVVFTGMGLEGDLAPRFSGDGLYRSNDVEQERRILAGLDGPNATTNEFERADVAPYETRGDGQLRANDFQLVKNYVAALVAQQPAGGPDVQTGAPLTTEQKNTTARAMRVVTGQAYAGGKTTVTVEMDPLGDETVTLFTLNFDPTILGNPVVTLADGMPDGTTLTANTDKAADGRLIVLIDSATPFLPSSSLKLVTVSFDVSKGAPVGRSPISFDASSSLSDKDARSLEADYLGSDALIEGRGVAWTLFPRPAPGAAFVTSAAVELRSAPRAVFNMTPFFRHRLY
ncbi:MAG TPA: hypothetical protein VNA17_00035 [Pyrinomonadaceae bacterium]|nr:hypothetical protein [Pyrinomonadaceae bacterium]